MYNIGIYIYSILIHLVALFHKKARQMVKGQHQTWSILKEKIDPTQQYIWIHAASLGEFEQGRPLIEVLKKEYPNYKILLTFYSPSGYNVAKNYPLADIICYLPFDTLSNVWRFFKLVQPKMVFFIKYEFWPNYFLMMYRKKIRLYSVSSIFRPNQIFFKPYGKFMRLILKAVSHFFVQNKESKELLATIGLTDNVTVVGDTRFDRVYKIMKKSKPLPIVEQFLKGKKQPFTVVAGSTWEPDEALLISFFNKTKEMQLIIAPHEVKSDRLALITQKLKRPYVFYSEIKEGDDLSQYDCLIIDCYGVLSSIYRYGEVAYIGGGFGVGIHNTVEAAVYGIPVVFGPNHHNFREAVEMREIGCGHSIEDQQELNHLLEGYLGDPKSLADEGKKAFDYISADLGATEKVLSVLDL